MSQISANKCTGMYFTFADLFQLVDVYDTGLLTHDEMFRVYKLLLGGAISDDHILDLTNRALQHPDLNKPGEISQDEFFRVCMSKVDCFVSLFRVVFVVCLSWMDCVACVSGVDYVVQLSKA